MATAPARSLLSNIGCRAGVTSASNLLQSEKRCAHPPLNHGRTRVLHGKRRDPESEAGVPELSRRIRGSGALEGLPEETRIAARDRRGRQAKNCEGQFLSGAARASGGLLQRP